MSHSITATGKNKNVIAELEMSAFNDEKIQLFYDSLDAQEFNNSVSGNGDSKIFTLDQIINAKLKFDYVKDEPIKLRNKDLERRSRFLGSACRLVGANEPEYTISTLEEDDVKEIEDFYNSIIKSGEQKIEIDFF